MLPQQAIGGFIEHARKHRHPANDLVGIISVPTFLVVASTAKNFNKYAPIIDQVYKCDGTADNVEIQAAIDASPAGGCRILFTEGTFNFATFVSVPNDIWLQGSGWGTIFRLANTTNTAILRNSLWQTSPGNQRIIVSDLMIDGNKANNLLESTGGISFSAALNILIKNVYVKDVSGYAGMYLVGYNASGEAQHIVDGCIVNGTENGGGVLGCGIYMSAPNVQKGIISNNIVSDCEGRGVFVEDGADDVIIANNHVHDNTGVNIALNLSDNAIIIGNNVQGGGSIGIDTGASTQVVIIGNLARGNTGIGIQISGNHATCVGNVVSNNSDGIVVAANITDFTITGNRCFDDQTPKVQDYGVNLASGTGYGTVVGNDLRGNQTGSINNAGSTTTTTIEHNIIDDSSQLFSEWVGASAFQECNLGTPSRIDQSASTRLGGWALDDATTEGVGGEWIVPRRWAGGAITVYYWFSMATATTGNVVIQGLVTPLANNELITPSPDISANQTVAVPGAALTLKYQSLGTFTPGAVGEIVGLRAARVGGDGADTATGDLNFHGFQFDYQRK